jgi:putative tryptophan/tyrosine transport system substrate-binding protein
MRRREFLGALGGVTAAWPLAARAQQPALPVLGFLEIRSSEKIAERLRAFRQGLKETGYVEGENIAVDYRWAEQMERLPELAAELARRQVAVIVTAGGFATALAAKGAMTTIPTRPREAGDKAVLDRIVRHAECCRGLLVSPCSSIQPIPLTRKRPCARWKRPALP